MKPVLVIMAAGMGSRYGGLKQIDPMDEYGHVILDYSVYDAKRAGFEDVVLIIRKEHEEDFRRLVTNRFDSAVNCTFAFQELKYLPEGFKVPDGRTKPWGTAHAVMSAMKAVGSRSFAVINADDYYGCGSYSLIYDFLSSEKEEGKEHFVCAAYSLKNTVTENGQVARGICTVDENGYLESITETTGIEVRDGIPGTFDKETGVFNALSPDTPVSMNMWGFTPQFFDAAWEGFSPFLAERLKNDPLTCEYYLPSVVENEMESGRADVRVLTARDRWYGVTHKADKESVVAALAALRKRGLYPLWEKTF